MAKTYTTIQGDMWDMISYRVYGDEGYVKILLEANQEYRNIAVFSAGIPLTCPDVDVQTTLMMPPWRRNDGA